MPRPGAGRVRSAPRRIGLGATKRAASLLGGAAWLRKPLGRNARAGVPRNDIEAALGKLLDEIEQQIAEDKVMGGPPQGTA